MWFFGNRKDLEEIEEAKRESDRAREMLHKARQEAKMQADKIHERLMEETLRGQVE